jgi:hypothetical protein
MVFLRPGALRPFALLLLTLAGSIFPFPSRAEDSNSAWTPDLASERGELDLRFSLAPEVLGLEESIDAKHAEGIREAHRLLGESAAPLSIGPQARFEGTYLNSEKLSFDQAKLKAVRESLLADLQQLPPIENLGFYEAYDALKTLSKSQANSAEHFTKNLRRLLRLSPFLFDRGGNASSETFSAADRIRKAAPLELQALYRDHFRVDLQKALFASPRLQDARQLKNEFPKIDAQFVEKTLLPATAPVAEEGGPVRTNTIVLEQVPAPYTVFRSSFGQDCSSRTIPYYGLHRDARVYWIYADASPSRTPIGYVFVLEIDYQNRKVPYVITVNGSNFSTSKTRKVIEAVAGLYGTEEVFLSSEKAEHVVNTNEIEKAFRGFRGRSVRLPAPDGWKKLQVLNGNYAPNGGHYYDWAGQLDSPRLAKVKPLKMADLPSTNRYARKGDFNEVEKIRRARAIVDWIKRDAGENSPFRSRRGMTRHRGRGPAFSFQESFESEFKAYGSRHPDALALLNLEKADIFPVYLLTEKRASRDDTQVAIQQFFETYGYQPTQLAQVVSLDQEAEIAIQLYRDDPKKLSKESWKTWFDRLHRSMTQKFFASEDYEIDLLIRPTLFPKEFGTYDRYDFFAMDPRPRFIPQDFKVLLDGPAESRIALIESFRSFETEEPGIAESVRLLFEAKEDIVRKYRLLPKAEQVQFAKKIEDSVKFAFTPRRRRQTITPEIDEEKVQTIAYFLREKFWDASDPDSMVSRRFFGERWSQVQRYVELRKKGLIGSEVDAALMASIIAVDPGNAEGAFGSRRASTRKKVRPSTIERLALELLKLRRAEGADLSSDFEVDFNRASDPKHFRNLAQTLKDERKASKCRKILAPVKATSTGRKRR